jgi:hypothetical protein
VTSGEESIYIFKNNAHHKLTTCAANVRNSKESMQKAILESHFRTLRDMLDQKSKS